MNGDQPFNTSDRSNGVCVDVASSPLTGITSAGFQNFRNATVTSSEKIADTMSTSPMS